MVKMNFSLIILLIGISIACVTNVIAQSENDDFLEESSDYLSMEQRKWYDDGCRDISDALDVKINSRKADNVILFVGDGMGPNSHTAARIYKGGEEGFLAWEKFPHMAHLKTYCADKQVPDSLATATALFGGVKSNYETGGVDASVTLGDCAASLDPNNQVKSILAQAQEAGMKTGFVTNTRVMHATPAALYAHTADRRWECESKMPAAAVNLGCKDIARQLVEDYPGKNINVIMGGGRQCMVSGVVGTVQDPIDTWSCISNDGRDLINDWKQDKKNRGKTNAVVQNNGELASLDTSNTDYVLGIFANGHLSFEHERDSGPSGMPSLEEMTRKAIKILSKNNRKGFLLVVEGGMIDQAHHRGWAKKALSEVLGLDAAVNSTVHQMQNDLKKTLIIVTSDHSHTLSINGYPRKGNSIFGIAQNSKFDGIPYTTLTYATGYDGYQVENVGGVLQRNNPALDDTESFEYMPQVAIKSDEATHGGVDVSVHAMGPWAHLFQRVHEQTYVSHVISYAARLGRYSDRR